MSGSRAGGLKARDKNIEKDPDFYKKLGRLGGSVKVPKGFAKNRELAVKAGRKAGSIGRVGHKFIESKNG